MLLLLLSLAAGAEELTKIISYNTLLTFNRAQRVEEAASYLRDQKADIILFQEISRQNSDSFARLARLWGHSHAVVAKPWDDYSIALTSKEPFEMVEVRLDGMHHGYVLVKIRGVYYMSLHFSSFTYARVIQESEIIVKRVKPLLASGARVVLAGDCNNPSPYDAAQVNSDAGMLEWRRFRERPEVETLRNGFFDFQAIQNLFDAGLEDVCFFWMKRNHYDPQLRLRVDLALLPRNLEDKVVAAYIDVSRRKYLETISDHYPLVLVLRDLHKEE